MSKILIYVYWVNKCKTQDKPKDNLSTILSSDDFCGDDILNGFDYSTNYGDILDPDVFQSLVPRCTSDSAAYPINSPPQISTPQYMHDYSILWMKQSRESTKIFV
jgi:hypothetical protein